MTAFVPCVDPSCSFTIKHGHQVEPGKLVARCSNFDESTETVCDGLLVFSWGMVEAACTTCGARGGIAVARWVEVTQ